MLEGLVQGEGFAIDASVIRADANRARGVPAAEWRQPEVPTRAVREYLDALEAANPVSDGPAASEQPHAGTSPKNLSLTDPGARWTAAPGGPAFYAYSTNYLIDLEAGIVVDVEATPAHRTGEVEATRTIIERVEQNFGICPRRLVADTAYGTGPLLDWVVNEKKIEPHIPVWDKSQREDGTFSTAQFRFNAAADVYECPGGKQLTSTGRQALSESAWITQ